jgi:hypothetical protein
VEYSTQFKTTAVLASTGVLQERTIEQEKKKVTATEDGRRDRDQVVLETNYLSS